MEDGVEMEKFLSSKEKNKDTEKGLSYEEAGERAGGFGKSNDNGKAL